jgi:hypothetical protein
MHTVTDSVRDPIGEAWWAGYMRGLRRAQQGDRSDTQAEHASMVAAAGSADARRNALGQGYKAGLTLLFHSPAVAGR